MKRKRKKEILTSEQREQFARTQRMLAERIAYHSAQLGEEPDPRLMAGSLPRAGAAAKVAAAMLLFG